MAERTTEFKFVAKADLAGMDQFGKALGALSSKVKDVSDDALRGLGREVMSASGEMKKSAGNINAAVSALNLLAQSATSGSNEFFELKNSVAALRTELNPGSISNFSNALSEQKRRLTELNLTTKEGRTEYAQLSRSIFETDRQLKAITGGFRQVEQATRAASAATRDFNAAQLAINPITGMATPRMPAPVGSTVWAQQQAAASLAAVPLALPAAGQSYGSRIREQRRQVRLAEAQAAADRWRAESAMPQRFGTTTGAMQGPSQALAGMLALPAGDDRLPAIRGGARRLDRSRTEYTFGESQFRNARAQAFMGRDVGAAAYRPEFGVGVGYSPTNAPFSNLPPNYFATRTAALGGLPGDPFERQRALAQQRLGAQFDQQQRLAGGGGQFGPRGARAGNRFMAAGAISAGAFFGGPEGAAGGLIGAALGGPGAALGGASIGAQVGIVRKQIGEFASLEAQLTKYNIALQNVAGSQAEFERAQAAITSANERLNIPLLQGTQTFTQLAAAVVGAGGKISDAELAFNAVNSAILATGGSSRDVEGAMLAITQVFSKGKVSAEELRQQLGERLPGAFNLFATSIGKTGPELDKALRDGTVGLNDLMTFLVDLQRRYQGTAEEIAASSEDAGARLTAAWEQARLAIGAEVQPIGAEFQERLIAFLVENEEGIRQFAVAMAGATKAAFDFAVAVGPTAVEVGKLVIAVNLTKAALGLLTPAIAAGIASMKGATGAAGLAAAGITKLRMATLALARAWAAPILLTVGIIGVSKILGDIAKIKEARNELENLNKPSQATDEFIRTNFRNSAVSADDRPRVISTMESLGDERAELERRVNDLRAQGDSRNQRQTSRSAARAQLATAERELQLVKERQAAVGQLLGSVGTGAGTPTGTTDFPSADPDDKASGRSAADTAERDAERLAAEQRRLAEATFNNKQQLDRRLFEFQMGLERERFDRLLALEQRRERTAIAGLPGRQQGVARAGLEARIELTDLLRQAATQGEAVTDARFGLEQAQQGQEFLQQFPVPSATQAIRGGGRPQAGGAFSGWDPELLNATAQVDRKYAVPVGTTAALFMFESGGSTSVTNRLGATGLFQVMPDTAPELGTTTSAIRGMGGVQQTALFDRYLQGRGFRPGMTQQQMYATVLSGNPWAGGRDANGTTPASGTRTILGYVPQAAQAISGVPMGGAPLRAELGDMRAEGNVEQAQQAVNFELEREKALREDILKIAQQTATDFAQQVANPFDQQREQLTDEMDSLKLRNRLLLEGVKPEVIEFEAQMLEIRKEQLGVNEALTTEIARVNQLIEESVNPGDKQFYTEYLKELENQLSDLPQRQQAVIDKQRELFNESQRLEQPWERLQLAIANVNRELRDLQDPVNQIQTLASGIGDAFGNSFGSVITGSSSVKEAMANLFRDVANLFADMVSRIIAKAIEAQILQGAQGGGGGLFGSLGSALFGGLGGGGGGGGGGLFPSAASTAVGGFSGAAPLAGGFLNPVVPFAQGGVVNNITPFRFASGGVMRSGVMGEAGPEAIMPLRRTASGDLGVVAAGGGRGGVVNQVTVNVDAKGSSVAGDNNESRKLGAAISDAVQSELVKQQRPGGLLDRSRTKR